MKNPHKFSKLVRDSFQRLKPKPIDWVNRFAPLEKRREVYLPDAVITLLRSPNLSPQFAMFSVPLTFNKLDMRDYLQRAYGVSVLGIRSAVYQMPLTRDRVMGRSGLGPWRRPPSKKKMIVKLVEPFVWPDAPTDFTPWERDSYFAVEEHHNKVRDGMKPQAKREPDEDARKAYAKQASQLLEGKKKWRPTWQALGLNYDRASVGQKVESPSS